MRILDLLKAKGELHIRGISRYLDIHPQTVDRIIDNYLAPFLDIRSVELYGFKAKLVRLKEDKTDVTIRDVLNYYRVKRQIKSR